MTTRKLAFGALFIALAILLPMMFHAVGLGKVFLPMHIPVLLAGFFCGPVVGMLVGMVSPLLSAFLTGMPPLMPPVAQMMVFELALYGLLTGLLYEKLHLGGYVSLIGAMIGGRVAYGILGYLVLPLFGFEKVPLWAPLVGAIGQSLPGVIIQLVGVPLVLSLCRRDWRVLFPEKRSLTAGGHHHG
ncbi:MAG: ECF transporter S component [Firmicutes bacterium]|nr:ECF transporter S component [Candidatus Fermentithermobacillaceae bacterium]